MKTVQKFSYLGCTISSDTKIDKEIDSRLTKASRVRLEDSIQVSVEQQTPEEKYQDRRVKTPLY